MSQNDQPRPVTSTELEIWKKQSEKGDPTAIANLRRAIREDPELIKRLAGDLCHNAERFNSMAAGCEREWMVLAIEGQLNLLRRQLEADSIGGKPSGMEILLIKRVATCWLTLHALEQESAMNFKQAPGKPPTLDKAIDRAHRRYTHAITSLARVRMMTSPLEIELMIDARLNGDQRKGSAPQTPQIEGNAD